ncbi:MAG: hypothetical protein ACREF9_13695, partial [Opitutaceae bacterium]
RRSLAKADAGDFARTRASYIESNCMDIISARRFDRNKTFRGDRFITVTASEINRKDVSVSIVLVSLFQKPEPTTTGPNALHFANASSFHALLTNKADDVGRRALTGQCQSRVGSSVIFLFPSLS